MTDLKKKIGGRNPKFHLPSVVSNAFKKIKQIIFIPKLHYQNFDTPYLISTSFLLYVKYLSNIFLLLKMNVKKVHISQKKVMPRVSKPNFYFINKG